MMTLKNFLLVGLGGGIGAMLRFFVAGIWKAGNFPFHTLFINIVGSLVIGLIFGLGIKTEQLSEQMKLFIATGICGGFTTFSAFSLENMLMLKSGNYLMASLYIFASVAICIVAVFMGYKIIN